MSGLALMLQSRGASVTGSDQSESPTTQALRDAGVLVSIGASAEHIARETDLVIASAAIRQEHPEVTQARALGIETITYAEALGRAQEGRTAVSIAGTHGKSTTTALLAHILVECGLDPSVIVGATCPQLGGGTRTGSESIPCGSRAGKPGIFVAEACEFNRSFHSHRPTLALINNVEEDHLDVYASLDEIVKAFRAFAGLLPAAREGGRLLIAYDGAHRRAVASGLACAHATFGWSPMSDYKVEHEPSTLRTSVWHEGSAILDFQGQLLGEHNALNASAAGILAHWLGAPREGIEAAIASFSGVDRRMQFLGEFAPIGGGCARVIDDYGHHPTECERTLAALRRSENPARLVCVFQPHQHSRTRFLLEQFAQSFRRADCVIVAPIYFVRDSEIERTLVCADDLARRLNEAGTPAIALESFEAIEAHLRREARDGDLVVVMGAGPVDQIGRSLVQGFRAAHTAPSPSMRAVASADQV